MSKTSQRKQSAYDLGVQDQAKGLAFRWKKHPYYSDYKRGYYSNCVKKSKFQRLKNWILK